MLKSKKKQSKETKHVSEPETDVIQILELLHRELKRIMITLRHLIEKGWICKNRWLDGNSKEQFKGNARNKKSWTWNEKCL